MANYERVGNKVKFTVDNELLKTKTITDIQESLGFHPAGYGCPFDITTDGKTTTFYCWGSCD